MSRLPLLRGSPIPVGMTQSSYGFAHYIATSLYCFKTLVGYRLGYRLVLGLGYGSGYWLGPGHTLTLTLAYNLVKFYRNIELSQYSARTQFITYYIGMFMRKIIAA